MNDIFSAKNKLELFINTIYSLIDSLSVTDPETGDRNIKEKITEKEARFVVQKLSNLEYGFLNKDLEVIFSTLEEKAKNETISNETYETFIKGETHAVFVYEFGYLNKRGGYTADITQALFFRNYIEACNERNKTIKSLTEKNIYTIGYVQKIFNINTLEQKDDSIKYPF